MRRRIGWLPRLALRGVAAVGMVALTTAAGMSIAVAAAQPTVRPVVLPRDHGAHPGFGVEWWYTAGTVADSNGHKYFWFATVWSAAQGSVARVNVVDLRADRVVLAREYISGTPLARGQAALQVAGFALGWQRVGSLGRWSIGAPTGSGLLRLTLAPRQPYVLNGHDGIIQQGPGGPSAYYSEPRLEARGVLELGGRRINVTGEGWLDHQWGNFIGNVGSLRWNWFACQFRDGRALMLYQFLDRRNRASSYRAGTLVTAQHRVEHLSHFTVMGLHPFVRPAGAMAAYPLRWRLEVPSSRLDLTLRALARHQFIKNSFVPSFWEGAAEITRGSPGSCIVESSREVSVSPSG